MLLTFATGAQWRGTGESCEESLKKSIYKTGNWELKSENNQWM